ncbi:hypothetical protein [Candidatus Hodgkinia cicadicola]|uniref:hypothetical protein n=1 Tax=Candidatus Hodgkinia cicadicola TaxID=573658 RepID=UPI0011BA6F64
MEAVNNVALMCWDHFKVTINWLDLRWDGTFCTSIEIKRWINVVLVRMEIGSMLQRLNGCGCKRTDSLPSNVLIDVITPKSLI